MYTLVCKFSSRRTLEVERELLYREALRDAAIPGVVASVFKGLSSVGHCAVSLWFGQGKVWVE
jgi:hypothetical protein